MENMFAARRVSLKFKRKDTTVFLFCDISDTFQKIKSQLFPLFGAKEEKDISLHSSDATTKYADLAMVSDFAALSDDAVVLVTLDAEVPTAIPAAQ